MSLGGPAGTPASSTANFPAPLTAHASCTISAEPATDTPRLSGVLRSNAHSARVKVRFCLGA